jgi:signal transduction histidine kinase
LIAGVHLKGDLMVGFAVNVTERHNLLEEMRESNRRANFIAEFSKNLSQTLDSREILNLVTSSLRNEWCDWCIVCSAQGTTQNINDQAENNSLFCSYLDQYEVCRADPQLKKGIYRAIQTAKSQLVRKVESPEHLAEELGLNCFPQSQELNQLASKSYMVVPLIARGIVLGALVLVSTRDEQLYSEKDLNLAEDLAFRAALAIENCNLYQKSKQAVELRDEFLSIASHELRTPLTSLRLQFELLQQSLTDLELNRLKRNLEIADQQVSRLSELVNELLDVSRIRAGRLILQRESVNLSALVSKVIDRYRSEVMKVGSSLAFHSSGVVIGNWDPVRIEQVVENLLSNAIKYGLGKPIKVSVSCRENWAILTVKDFGIGIERENQSRIFSRFERAVSSKKYSGLGLGLYIVRQIVESHQGDIRVESTPSRGSTFTIELPMS